MLVVVPGVLGQYLSQVPLAEDQHVVEAFAPCVPTNRSAYELDTIINYTRSR